MIAPVSTRQTLLLLKMAMNSWSCSQWYCSFNLHYSEAVRDFYVKLLCDVPFYLNSCEFQTYKERWILHSVLLWDNSPPKCPSSLEMFQQVCEILSLWMIFRYWPTMVSCFQDMRSWRSSRRCSMLTTVWEFTREEEWLMPSFTTHACFSSSLEELCGCRLSIPLLSPRKTKYWMFLIKLVLS